MDLHSDDARLSNVRFFFFVIDCLNSIEPKLNVGTFSTNAIFIPLAKRFGRFGKDFVGRFHQDFVAAAFVVESPIVTSAEVRLIT